MDTNAMIRKIVGLETVWQGDSKYKSGIKRMAEIDLAYITEADVKDIVKDHLYGFLGMGRSLGREKYLGWQVKVAAITASNSETLKQFQERSINNTDLVTHQREIVRLFESFRGTIGSIASGKLLNLVCPRFFPLWDTRIANAIRVELARVQGGEFNKDIEPGSGEDYFRFMEATKLFASRHAEQISLLCDQYQQEKLRLIDQCFWWVTQNPLFLLFSREAQE